MTAKDFKHSKKLFREARTITAMMKLYCRQRHHPFESELCSDCNELLNYSLTRLSKCIFSTDKPACQNCEVHCYGKKQRQCIREVMKYAGPRMLLHHPVMAAAHLLDEKLIPSLKPKEFKALKKSRNKAG